MRADALRNRERLLVAAEEVFTEQGTGASTEEVARRAGVGIGTVFRHFPTKEALLTAVYERLLQELGERAAELAGHDDPGTAFFDFLTLAVGRSGAKNAFADALTEAGVAVPDSHSALGAALAVLLTRAQEAGAARADLTLPDVRAILIGIVRALEQLPDDPAARARVTSALLAGLRA